MRGGPHGPPQRQLRNISFFQWFDKFSRGAAPGEGQRGYSPCNAEKEPRRRGGPLSPAKSPKGLASGVRSSLKRQFPPLKIALGQELDLPDGAWMRAYGDSAYVHMALTRIPTWKEFQALLGKESWVEKWMLFHAGDLKPELLVPDDVPDNCVVDDSLSPQRPLCDSRVAPRPNAFRRGLISRSTARCFHICPRSFTLYRSFTYTLHALFSV